jgi:calcineurin-like phosphoesterase family protein
MSLKINNSEIPSYLTMKLDSQNIFFTSDTHFFHSNVIKFDNRPFNDVEEMNETIIENWNNKVPKDGVVFFLGDLSFKSFKQTEEIFSKLNGTIHVINGNHDRWKVVKNLNIASIQNMLEIKVLDSSVENHRFDGRQPISLCHYPLLVWDKHHAGSWHLHGHCHHNLVNNGQHTEYYKRKVIDVGTNGHNYTPLSYDDVKNIMNNKDIKLIDHL